MKLLEFTGQATSRLIEADAPAPQPGEVLIQTARSAICGSEMKAYRGAGMAGGNSGHEAVGTVIELGDGCGRPARLASASASARLSAVAIAPNARAVATPGATRPSRARACTPSNLSYPPAAAAFCPMICPGSRRRLLTGDGLGVPWHTAKKIDRADIETIVVMGLGPIGLGNVLLQAHLGRRVIGVDHHRLPHRLSPNSWARTPASRPMTR